jgi:hypothetical protein
VPSFEGHIYVIDGLKKCAERIDIGEHIYSTPLMDDVTGNGFIYVCIYVCVRVSVYVSIYIYIYVYIYTHIFVCIFT